MIELGRDISRIQESKELEPFKFRFNPEEKIPEVFQNKTAFIIWTVWRSRHIISERDLVKEASITAARILQEIKPPFSTGIKEKAIRQFVRYLHPSYLAENGTGKKEIRKEVDFWEKQIFPFLEGKREFKWEMIQKCFYCSNDAIAICDSCSPTSATGKTLEKPLCGDCIASGAGINVKKWLIPKNEGKQRVEYALRKLKSREIKS